MGTRRATEFRITMERIVDFMGSCGEGRVGPFISPVQDLGSNRATPGTRPFFKLTPDYSLLQTSPPSPHVVRHRTSPLSRAYSNLQPKSRKSTIFLAHLRSPVRHGLLPGPRGSCHLPLSSEKVCPCLESIQTQYMLILTVLSHVDFVQDLHLSISQRQR